MNKFSFFSIALCAFFYSGSLLSSNESDIGLGKNPDNIKENRVLENRILEFNRIIGLGNAIKNNNWNPPAYGRVSKEEVIKKNDKIKKYKPVKKDGRRGENSSRSIKKKNPHDNNVEDHSNQEDYNFLSTTYVSNFSVNINTYSNYPNRTVGKIYAVNNQQIDYVCSGSAVGASHVLTAGHCVLDPSDGDWADTIIFAPAYYYGYDSNYGLFYSTNSWATNEWINEYDACRDVGYVKVGNNSQGNNLFQEVGYLGWVYNSNRDTNWRIKGYPADYPYDGEKMVETQTDTYLTSVRSRCSSTSNSPHQIQVLSSLTGGASGGPWFVTTNNGSSVVNGVLSLGGPTNDGNGVISPYFDATISNHLSWLRNQ